MGAWGRWCVVAVITGLWAVIFAMSPAGASARDKLLVYTGNGAINEGYSQFAAQALLTQETSSTFPSTPALFDEYECVVLPVNQTGFSAPDRTALGAYMNRGGTVIALAEHLFASPVQPVGPNSVTTMNNLASSYGIQGLNTSVNQTATSTTDVLATPWTQGVSTVQYAATTTLTVSPPAVALLRTVKTEFLDPDPTPFLALRQLGLGTFVYSGDSNIFSNGGGGRYSGTDNGRLARNLCGDIAPPVITLTTPAQGARYPKNAVVDAEWTCTDASSGVDTQGFTNGALTGTVSGVPFDTSVAAGQSVTKSYSVDCKDKAGNVAPTVTHQYVVDDRPPTIVINVPGPGPYQRGSFVEADWSCSDPDNDIATKVYVNGALSGSASGQPIDTATKGVKSFTVTCTDLVGNSASATVQYTVANSPPVASIATPVEGARFRLDQVVNADWACTDPDGPADIDPDSNKTFGTVADGDAIDTAGVAGQTIAKTISVTCTDLAGVTATTIHTYFIDGNPPIVTIAVPLEGASYPRGSSQPASWSCSDPDGAADLKTAVATLPVGTPVNTGTLGPKSFTVTCTDQAGNVSTKTVTYTVIGGPPDILITTPANGATYTQGQVVPPTYSCTDKDGDLKSCVRDGGATGPVDTSKPGTFSFTVNAEDVPGNKATKTVTYTVKAKPAVAGAGVSPSSKPGASKVCKSRRQFRIRVKKLRGGVTAVSATVFVNGKKTLTRKGKRVTATVTLKGLKKGQYKVKINVKYSNGRTLSYTRKFKTCTPKGK